MHPESTLAGWGDGDLARASLDALPTAVCVLDENTCLVAGNRAFFQLVHGSSETLLGQPLSCLGELPGLVNAVACSLEGPSSTVPPFHLTDPGEGAPRFTLSTHPVAKSYRMVHITRRSDPAVPPGLDTPALARLTEELVGFSYSVAHDLRAPLRFIEHFAYLLMDKHGAELSSDALQYAEQIGEASRQTARLVDDLLAFSQVTGQPLRREPIDLSEIVGNVISQFPLETEGRQVEFQFDGLGTAVGDPSLVQQIFANLIGNALKFTRPRELARIVISQNDASGTTVYTVSDNGVGFDPSESERIFTVFQRYHQPDAFEGSGVGLAVVKRIVRRHGGSVWAEGIPEGGAQFHFTLAEAPADGQ